MSELPPPPGRPSPSPPPPPPPSGSAAVGGNVIPLRPLSLGDIFDAGITLVRNTFGQSALAVLVVFGPLQAVSALALSGLPVFSPFSFGTTAPQDFQFTGTDAAGLAVAGLAGLASFLVTPLVSGAVTLILAGKDVGQELDWRGAYRRAWSRYGSLLGAALFIVLMGVGVVIVLGLLALLGVLLGPVGLILILPGLLILIVSVIGLAGLSYLVVPPIVLEGAGARRAIGRVWRLVRPRVWTVLGIGILAGIIVLILQTMVGLLTAGLAAVGALLGPVGWIMNGLGSILSQIVTLPVAAAFALLIYIDLRIRREGFDIEVMIAALGEPR